MVLLIELLRGIIPCYGTGVTVRFRVVEHPTTCLTVWGLLMYSSKTLTATKQRMCSETALNEWSREVETGNSGRNDVTL